MTDYTQQFNDFCQAMADEMNSKNPLGFQVTVRDVKAMPEAVNAFMATLELAGIIAKV